MSSNFRVCPLLSQVSAPFTKILSVSTFEQGIVALIEVGGLRRLYSWGKDLSDIGYSGDARVPYIGDLYMVPSSEVPISFEDHLDPESSYTSTGDYRYSTKSFASNNYETVVLTKNKNVTDYFSDISAVRVAASSEDDQVLCGDRHCGLLTKSGELYMWHDNEGDCAELGGGNGLPYQACTNALIRGYQQFNTTDSIRLAALGSGFTVVATDAATDPLLFAGGCEPDGMCQNLIADNSYYDFYMPVPVARDLLPAFSGNDVVALAAGRKHAMAIINNGTERYVIGFGNNEYGQVYGYYNSSVAPSVLPPSWFTGFPTGISCVRDTTFLLTTVGSTTLSQKVWVWGYNGLGSLFGPGHDGILTTRGRDSAVLLMLPASLGQPYTVKSIPSSPTATSVFAIVEKKPLYYPYATYEEVPEQPRNESYIGVGTDIPFIYDNYQAPVFTFKPVAATNGTVIPLGSGIPETETIVQVAFSSYTRWYLTDANRIYASGAVIYLPKFMPAISVATRQELVVPRLFFDGFGDIRITKIVATDTSLVFLLENGRAFFFWSTDGYSAYNHMTGIDWQIDLSVPAQVPARNTYSNITCTVTGCCLLSASEDAIDCFGELGGAGSPAKRDMPATTPFWRNTPGLTITGKSATHFAYSWDNTILYQNASDGHWMTYDSKGGDLDVSGEMPSDAAILQLEVGRDFLLALVANKGMYSFGSVSSGQGNTSQMGSWGPWYHDHPSTAGGIQSIAAVGYTSLWLSAGTVYLTGRDISPQSTWVTTNVNYGFPLAQTPKVLQTNSNFQVLRLYSSFQIPWDYDRVIYNWPWLNSMVIMAVRPAIVVPPPQVAPSLPPAQSVPTPVASHTGCSGTAPFANCECLSGAWKCVGTVQLTSSSSKVVVTGPVDLVGDLVVSSPGALVVQLPSTTEVISGRALINVSGCVNLQAPITVELTDPTVRGIPTSTGRTVGLIESSCLQGTSGYVTGVQTGRKCKKIATQEQQTTNPASRTTISAVFTVTRDTCSYWWVILLSVVGSVIIVAAVAVVVILKVPAVRKLVQPYRGTNA